MSDRDLPASADLVRQARSNLLNEVVWPSLAVQRLVFIRGTSGIGDSLNGLVSAYWLSHILGAELSLCWPEATHMPWRVLVYKFFTTLTSAPFCVKCFVSNSSRLA